MRGDSDDFGGVVEVSVDHCVSDLAPTAQGLGTGALRELGFDLVSDVDRRAAGDVAFVGERDASGP